MESAQSLNEAYPDAIGWLYIPNTNISYPVTQGKDNEYYLSHAYDGSSFSAGAIFLDYRCENRFMNPVNILYGHSMKNGTMFAGVLNFADSSYFESHRYGWLATPETVYRIDFFSCAKTDCNDKLYGCILHCLTAGFAEQIGLVAPAVGRDAEHSGRLGFLPAEAGFHL